MQRHKQRRCYCLDLSKNVYPLIDNNKSAEDSHDNTPPFSAFDEAMPNEDVRKFGLYSVPALLRKEC
jgi:hypothetical protein